MEKEEEQSQTTSDTEVGWRLSLSWERQALSKEGKTVGALIWIGRFVILLSLIVALGVDISVLFGWVAAAMLLIYILYVVIYWRAILVKRIEVVLLTVIALALAVLYIWTTASRMVLT